METVAHHPAYQDPSVGDLIIRTSDNVSFHVHRRRIADVSPIFADMFTLPEPPAEKEGEKPAVDVSESSEVWKKLLPYIYVDAEPAIALSEIHALLEASKKYQIAGIRSRMATLLTRWDHMYERPFAVYALACAEGLPEIARMAARRTLRLPACPPHLPEYSLVSGRAISRLLQYREDCAKAARAAVSVEDLNQSGQDSRWMIFSLPQRSGCGSPSCPSNASVAVETRGLRVGMHVHPQWLAYLRKLAKELATQPWGPVAHRAGLLEPFGYSVVDSCAQCRQAGIWDEIQIFAQEAETRIEAAIDKVVLVVES